MKLVSATKSFDGWVKRYQHYSECLQCDMVFAIYLPPQVEHLQQKDGIPLLYWLSGLTCTDENFMQKAGAQKLAAELGLAIVCPDTSPRGTDLVGEHDSYDLGSGAGFYVNATQAPWSQHYQMYDYIRDELPALIRQHFPVGDKAGISGHSMGGHGALTIALKNSHNYTSVSAFAPICHPTQCVWGKNIFSHYLGDDQKQWQAYDATLLIAQAQDRLPLLVDQGEDDEFLTDQLQPKALQAACEAANYPLTLRMHSGYDHSYFFIASFIEEHLRYHYRALTGEAEAAYY